jgi:bleomycin hydrolase
MGMASAANAGDCAHLYQLLDQELAGVKPSFLAEHNNHYTLDVPVTPIKNQCNYGGCWVYGTVSNIEARVLKRTGRSVDLSEQYLIAHSLRDRAERALNTPGNQTAEGGNFGTAEELIRRHGLVPRSAWQPRIPFEKSPHSGRLGNFLNNRIAQFHVEAAENPANIEQLRAVAKKDVLELIEAYTGPLPQAFKFERKNYPSPQAFADSLLPARPTPAKVSVHHPEIPKMLFEQRPGGKPNKVYGPVGNLVEVTESFEKVEQRIVDTLRKGQTVSVALEWEKTFIDKETGIMSINAFHVPKGYKPVTKVYRDWFGTGGGGHQVEIVGVDLDQNGRVLKYKLKNSWGEKSGDAGYYHMYPDYFENYLMSVVVP